MKDKTFVLASDIGGSHITSAIVDSSNWSILPSTITRSVVDSNKDAKSIFHDWTTNIQQCIDDSKLVISTIGIAMPGPFDYENGISLMNGQTKYDSIYQMHVTPHIHDHLKSNIEQILFINDAAAFLQGEIFAQKLNEKGKILGITLGTGLGSAVWEKGKKAFDADLWNSPYQDSIYEEHLVTRWFVRRFEELTGTTERGLKEILANHPETKETAILLKEYAEHLLHFMDFFSKKHDCSSFIIGGNIAKAWTRIQACDPTGFERFDISIGQYQEVAAIIGAASLFENNEAQL